MGWKIGYPTGLVGGSSFDETDGKNVYLDRFSGNGLTVTTTQPKWEAGIIESVSTDTITIITLRSDVSWSANEFQFGSIINLTAARDGNTIGSFIASNTEVGDPAADKINVVVDTGEGTKFEAGEYVHFLNGRSGMELNATHEGLRNPTNWSFNGGFDIGDTTVRFLGMGDGFEYALGFRPDDLVLSFDVHTDDDDSADKLIGLLDGQFRKKLDYSGSNPLFSNLVAAPQIIEMGSTDYQLIASIADWTFTKEAKRGNNFIKVELQLTGVSIPEHFTYQQG